ncbi:MAG: DUF488 family protein [Chlorobaculum sp.]|nr:DUF488 family protein [Chlorobaculum sp.]
MYEPASPDDGYRVLVDRLWPRGLTKERVQASMWLKEAAPETPLRKWFGHDPAKFREFRHRYLEELSGKPDVMAGLLELARKDRVTLLYAARDPECNHAVVLRDYLLSREAQDAE